MDLAKKYVLKVMTQLISENQFRPAAALANVCIKKYGYNDEMTKLAQKAVASQKIRIKALTIAKAALEPIKLRMLEKKYWTAKTELDKANAMIGQRVTEQETLAIIKSEMAKTSADVEAALKNADNRIFNIFEVAKRDPLQGEIQLNAFSLEFPDYPNYDADKIKIGDLKYAQVYAKFKYQLNAIEEIIPNDPAAAKIMITNLLANSEMAPENAAILKSKITAFQRSILNKEVDQIRERLDEAQAYLAKFDAKYAEELKKGNKPETTLKQHASIGVENLVRANSIQSGAVKQLEILLNEEMDNVTRAKLVGLLETQKNALQQMDETLRAQKGQTTTLPH